MKRKKKSVDKSPQKFSDFCPVEKLNLIYDLLPTIFGSLQLPTYIKLREKFVIRRNGSEEILHSSK